MTHDAPSATELVEAALGKSLDLPRLPEAPNEVMARTASGVAIAAGTGDKAVW